MFDSRRSFFTAGAWAWLSRILPAPAAAKPKSIYEELGIRPLINFRGTHTTIGASKQWPELHAYMEEAARHFVSLEELQDKAGERIAKLIGTEFAMVTTGTAGALTVATCACVAGSDSKAIRRLPDLSGLKNEAIILKQHRNGYDHAVRNVGVRIIEVETADQLKAAINPQTAVMYFLGGSSGDWAWPETLSIEQCLKICKPAGVPILVDAANMLPPFDNLRKLASAGADLIAVSGGKHMRGPQCSGILAGRKDLITAARLNMSPHSDSLGRPMKVGREEIVGCLMACEKYATLDFESLDRECLRQAEYLKSVFAKIPNVETGLTPNDRTRKVRRVYLSWDEKKVGLTAADVEKQLLDGSPSIAVLRHSPQGVLFTVLMNDSGDEKLAARRVQEIFRSRA